MAIDMSSDQIKNCCIKDWPALVSNETFIKMAKHAFSFPTSPWLCPIDQSSNFHGKKFSLHNNFHHGIIILLSKIVFMPPKSEMNIVWPHFWSWTKVTNFEKCSYVHELMKSNYIFIFDLDMTNILGLAPALEAP